MKQICKFLAVSFLLSFIFLLFSPIVQKNHSEPVKVSKTAIQQNKTKVEPVRETISTIRQREARVYIPLVRWFFIAVHITIAFSKCKEYISTFNPIKFWPQMARRDLSVDAYMFEQMF